MNWILIYHVGLVFWITMFYHGSIRGGSQNTWLWTVIFGVFWPASMIAFIVTMFTDRKK